MPAARYFARNSDEKLLCASMYSSLRSGLSLATKTLVSMLFRSLSWSVWHISYSIFHMKYGIWNMELLPISDVSRFNGVTLAGLGLKNDHARFRLFNLYHFAAGFDQDGKPGAHATAQPGE